MKDKFSVFLQFENMSQKYIFRKNLILYKINYSIFKNCDDFVTLQYNNNPIAH